MKTKRVCAQVWMWYLSVTLLVIMVTFLTIRCLLFFFAWIAGYEFWVLPRLFDETLAFAESFTPVRNCRPDGRAYTYQVELLVSFVVTVGVCRVLPCHLRCHV